MAITPDLYADPQNPSLPKANKVRVQAPYWYRFYVGDAEITVVSHGWQMLGDPTNSFLGVPKDEVRGQFHEPVGYEYRAQLVRR